MKMSQDSSARHRLNKALGLFVSVPMFALPAVAQETTSLRTQIRAGARYLRTGLRGDDETKPIYDIGDKLGLRAGLPTLGIRIGNFNSDPIKDVEIPD